MVPDYSEALPLQHDLIVQLDFSEKHLGKSLREQEWAPEGAHSRPKMPKHGYVTDLKRPNITKADGQVQICG